ncbi:hypothetical protein GCM10009775_07220 [Microbacterium aoyamense]|uniref:NifU family protein n=1 Tax=Microbacterium aoyamense TaxID=344166 RepID=A0ABN2PBQ2_9MICO|nr:hypothetical protein [Microbacterium aoyamense]
MTSSTIEVEAALGGLRTALEAGGYGLSVDEVRDDGTVQLAITAGPDACEDCVMPDDMLVLMAGRALVERGLPTGEVRLRKDWVK